MKKWLMGEWTGAQWGEALLATLSLCAIMTLWVKYVIT